MRWEELTADRFVDAVELSGGVCLLPLSVVERHSTHLPLGTDVMIGRAVAERAAAIEPALIFPDHIYTQIPEARHHPGTVALDGELMLRLLDAVCTEIARNGLDKIVLVNAHGGNFGLLSLFPMLQLERPRDYVVYIVDLIDPAVRSADAAAWDGDLDGHAGRSETAMIRALRPELIDEASLPNGGEGRPLGRLDALREAGVRTGIWWYADHPEHYSGDARSATAEVGERLLEAQARHLARAVRAVKDDRSARELQDEFFRRVADESSS